MSRLSALRRSAFVAVTAALAAGGLLLGTAGPASADPPALSFADLCGAAELSWDAGPVLGGEPVPTTVLRDGVVLDEFAMGNRGRQRYGAADGATFVVRRDGLPDTTFRYEAPGDCADASRLAVSVTDECFSAMLRLDNTGTTAVDGLRLHTTDVPAGRALPPVEPGVTEVPVAVADGDFYRLTAGPAGADAALWLQGVHDRPAGCGPDAVAVTVTDGCRGTRLTLVNRAEGVVRVEVVVGAAEVPYARALAAGASDTVDLPVAPGTTLVVRDSVAGVRFAEHTTVPVPCASPSDDPTGAPGEPGGGQAGGLPVTGVDATGYAAAGALLAVAGVGMAVLARRRRTRFTAGD